MIIIKHGTPEWYQARIGKITASCVADIMPLKSGGYSKKRQAYLLRLAKERITGQLSESFVTSEMQWGIDNEQSAIANYAFLRDVEVEQGGFVQHPTIENFGASPDGFVGDVIIEAKCPKTETLIKYVLGEGLDDDHAVQTQAQLSCCKFAVANDYIVHDPRLPDVTTFCKRTYPVLERIKLIEAEVIKADQEVEEIISKFKMNGATSWAV